MQLFASRFGYSGAILYQVYGCISTNINWRVAAGPIDGTMGPNSWAGVQRGLTKQGGYTGPADGAPGPNTYKAMQRIAQKYGYGGPIDGDLGPESYKGFAKFLNTL